MLVRLHANGIIALDLPADVTWSGGFTGRHGRALVRIPRTSPAWDPDYLAVEGGAYVEIVTQAGTFRGISDRPTFTPDGAELEIMPLSVWLEGRLVAPHRTFRACVAGAIARQAALDALGGLGAAAILPGTFCEGGAIIPVYEFSSQPLLTVLTELSQHSGQSWEIDDRGQLNWVPVPGRYREVLLVDDGRLFGRDAGRSLRDRARVVIEQDRQGITYRAFAGEVPILWPAERQGGQNR